MSNNKHNKHCTCKGCGGNGMSLYEQAKRLGYYNGSRLIGQPDPVGLTKKIDSDLINHTLVRANNIKRISI